LKQTIKIARNHLTRRHWLASAASAAAVLNFPPLALATEAKDNKPDMNKYPDIYPDKYPWIDAHSHVWSHDVEKYPLANNFTIKSLQPLFTEKELLQVAHANGVGRVVLIHHHPFHGWDNSYLLDVAARMPKIFRVAGIVDNLAANPGAKMRRMLKQHVTGFRITSDIHKEKWLAGGMDDMWRTAAETGQSICCLINPDEIEQIDAMCNKHPETPVVIDHFARVGVDGQIRDAQVQALCGLARHPRTTLKISAYYALGKKKPPYTDLVPMIRRVFDAFGPERLMWASDSPYQLSGENSYEDSIGLVRDRIDFLSAGDREWILRKTAERVFFYT
jgi:predicted TIM-barrel fold metal-dependent hydrolase